MVSRVATTRSVCEASTIALLIQIGKPKLESDLKPMYVGISYVHRGGCGSADTTSRQLNFDEMYLVWYPGYILRGEAQLAVQLVLVQ